MKYIQHIIIIFAVMLTGVSFGQINLSDLNYVHTITPQQPVTIERLDLVGGDDEPAEKRHIQQVTYYDGLGREMQSIGIKHNPGSKDIVTHAQYDPYGRQARQYLPFKRNTANGTYEAVDIDQDINSYYHTTYSDDFPGITDHRQINAYSETLFEPSPLNRPLEQGAPGSAWKIGSDSNVNHTIKSDWRFNTANEVVYFRVGFTGNDTEKPTLIKVGYYANNQLHVAITKDENYSTSQALENEHTSREYTNKQGQVVLTRTYAGSSVAGNAGGGPGAHDTYYVYDRFGNLTFVIPPKVDVTDGISTIELNELCYQYVYDNRNRLIEKKIPGKGWESIIYNKLDQPVLTQDALLKQDNQWLFTKYDAYGRVAYTGKVTDNRDRIVIQNELTGFTGELWVNRSSANHIGGVARYYDNGGYPATQPIEVLTISYYDDYSFLGANPDPKLANPGTVDGETILSNTKSLPTGSLVKVLDTNNWITSVTYYDKKARPVYAATKNDYLSSIDVVATQLDFTGKVKQSTSTHSKDSHIPIITLDKMTYDHVGRPLVQTQTINGHEELISANTYDALGQLQYKNVGGQKDGNGLQKVDYAYNIRGWLKTINEGATANGDLFGFKINYSNPTLGGTALFNGNISETSWKTQSINPNPPNNPISSSYIYDYDALNRITSAIDNTTHYNLNNVTYNKNGNIQSLSRNGLVNTDNNTFGTIDALSYGYDVTSNKLIKVEDSSGNVAGFFNGVNEAEEYRYDDNGNMILDSNKGITDITYNHLNLPTKVTVSGAENGTIAYVYDATGVKFRKIAYNESIRQETVVDYIDGYIYENSDLQYIITSEGYVIPEGTDYRYVYQYKDHLDNVRLSYTKNDAGNLEIIEEKNYYPFGSLHLGYNNIVSSHGNSSAQLIGFGGKEEQSELGLGWIDIISRNYDPILGRWMSIDPMTDKREWLSPYQYVQNSPMLRVDPDGAFDKFYSNNDGTIEQVVQDGAHEFYVQTSNGDKGVFAEDYKKVATLTENTDGLVQFPDSGSNYGRYGTNDAGGTSTNPSEEVGQGDRFVTPETAAALFGLVSSLEIDGLNIDLGDMSSSNGSDPWQAGFFHHSGHGHNGNRTGLDVDFRYLNTSGNSFQSGNAFNSSSFSSENNQNVYDTATTFGFTVNYQGNSGNLIGPTNANQHNDHGHLGRGNNNSNVTTVSRLKPSRPVPVSSSFKGF